MPHKHKRKREADPSSPTHDLPPTSRARTLTVHKSNELIFTSDIEKKRKYEARREKKEQKRRGDVKGAGSKEYRDDDTPKAFKRMMMMREGRKLPSGLDDGAGRGKKGKKVGKNRKAGQEDGREGAKHPHKSTTAPASQLPSTIETQQPPTTHPLQILPTESLSTFAQRVDHSLPLASIPKYTTRLPPTTTDDSSKPLSTQLTKHNKRLHRLQSAWRLTDKRLQEKALDAEDDEIEKKEEQELIWIKHGLDPSGNKKKKGKGGGSQTKDVDEGDVWKVLERKRWEEGKLRQRGLQDVVVAPPVLRGVKNMFKRREGRGDGGIGR